MEFLKNRRIYELAIITTTCILYKIITCQINQRFIYTFSFSLCFFIILVYINRGIIVFFLFVLFNVKE